MRSLPRTVVGGGIAALAVVAAAGSAAFACTAQSTLSPPGQGGKAGGDTFIETVVGGTVKFEASGFMVDSPASSDHHYEGYGRPEFHWIVNRDDQTGPLIGYAGEPTWTVTAGGEPRAKWYVELPIPTGVTPRVASYYVQSTQAKPDGTLAVTGSIPVIVLGEIPVSQPEPNAIPSAPPPAPPAALIPGGPANGPKAPSAPASAQLVPTNPRSARGPASSTGASAGAGASGSASSSQAPPSKAAGPSSPSTPSAPGAIAVPASVAPTDPSKQAVPDDALLWNGLQGSTSALSLLDAPVPASSGSGLPAGAVLLGMGLLALGGTAAITAQRRLALAKAVRR